MKFGDKCFDWVRWKVGWIQCEVFILNGDTLRIHAVCGIKDRLFKQHGSSMPYNILPPSLPPLSLSLFPLYLHSTYPIHVVNIAPYGIQWNLKQSQCTQYNKFNPSSSQSESHIGIVVAIDHINEVLQ